MVGKTRKCAFESSLVVSCGGESRRGIPAREKEDVERRGDWGAVASRKLMQWKSIVHSGGEERRLLLPPGEPALLITDIDNTHRGGLLNLVDGAHWFISRRMHFVLSRVTEKPNLVGSNVTKEKKGGVGPKVSSPDSQINDVNYQIRGLRRRFWTSELRMKERTYERLREGEGSPWEGVTEKWRWRRVHGSAHATFVVLGEQDKSRS